MTLAQRMVVMNKGVPEQIGTPTEVFEKPASTFVAGFIGSPPMNLMPVTVSDDGMLQTPEGATLDISPQQLPAQHRGRGPTQGMRPNHMLHTPPGPPPQPQLLQHQRIAQHQ